MGGALASTPMSESLREHPEGGLGGGGCWGGGSVLGVWWGGGLWNLMLSLGR